MKIRILGCGHSSGVPSIYRGWGNCCPDNPKNKRTRSAILLQKDGFNLLVDTPPEIREQLSAAGMPLIRNVLFTHAHADHIMGADDLRGYSLLMKKSVDIYLSEDTLNRFRQVFSYGFLPYSESNAWLLHLSAHTIEFGKTFQVGPFDIIPVEQIHGKGKSTGFRFGDFSYNTDISQITEEVANSLTGVKVWVVECTSMKKHYGKSPHLDLNDIVYWTEKLGIEKVFLTHMGESLDYDALCAALPSHIRPCFDGLEFEC
jgi:phosphoribosyl 1,2-cyclic phosphate phosphodiesterase